MVRPLTRAQRAQNAAFLKALRRTGNVREAARALGVHRATFARRRAKHPDFAARWDAALAVADAAAHLRLPPGDAEREPRVVRTASGRLQLRRAVRGRLTGEGEQRFLAALSATANVRLAAAAAGFTHGAFYQLARRNQAFAREMRLAIEAGYQRLETELLATMAPTAHGHDAWRHNEPPAVPPMTASQALQLMYLHHKTARLWEERPDRRKKRGESPDMHMWRLAGMYGYETAQNEARWAALRAQEDAARAGASPHEPPPAVPDLAQVTGWSKAAPGAPDADRALFGGKRRYNLTRASWRKGGDRN